MPPMRGVGLIRAVLALSVGATFNGTPAQAETRSSTLIWYRSAEGCPEGAGFLARLETRGVRARLAQVGDPIDFVVTLGNGPEGAGGLLERQTKTGTVAIRRIDGGTCDEIADGVALTLSLADTPEEHQETQAAPALATESRAETRLVLEEPTRDTGAPKPTQSADRTRRARFAFGFQGNAISGVAPDTLPGATLFLSFAPGGPSLPRGASVRVSAFGNTRGASVGDHDYRLWLFGGRFDACPVHVGSSTLHASPCASIDLGALRATGNGAGRKTNDGFWAALRAGVRLEFRVVDPVALEAQVEAVAPLTRYDIVAGAPQTTLYRTAPLGLGVGAGASFRLP
jgi:hypothetical protein